MTSEKSALDRVVEHVGNDDWFPVSTWNEAVQELAALRASNAALRKAATEYLDSEPTEYFHALGSKLTRITETERNLRAALQGGSQDGK